MAIVIITIFKRQNAYRADSTADCTGR